MKVKTSPELKTKKPDTRGVQPRNRIKYSNIQLRLLEKVFLSTQYPDSSTLEDLSTSIDVSVERLSIWFQNRRSKFKRQSKDSHVTWMRQQIYQPGTSKSRDVRSEPPKYSGHVLSPPVQNAARQQTTHKPSSNLHYLPTTTPTIHRGIDYDPYSLMTSPQLSTNENVNINTPTELTTSPPLLSQLLTDTPEHIPDNTCHPYRSWKSTSSYECSEPQTPYYPLPSSGYYGLSNFAHVESQYYQTYPPCYNFPSTQMNFPQIGV